MFRVKLSADLFSTQSSGLQSMFMSFSIPQMQVSCSVQGSLSPNASLIKGVDSALLKVAVYFCLPLFKRKVMSINADYGVMVLLIFSLYFPTAHSAMLIRTYL